MFASIASESPGKTKSESQVPLSSWTEQQPRTERPVQDARSSSYSEWNADESWSSQEWKSDEVLEVRTGRLGNEQPPGLFTQHTNRFIVDDDDMDSNTVTESDLSLKIQIILAQGECSSAKDVGPILKRCNTRQQQTFFKMVNVYEFNIGSICIQGEEYSEKSHNVKNPGINLAMKQMFDISEKFIVGQSDEIYGVTPINNNLWSMMKKSSVSRTRRFTYFQILCYALERCTKTHNQILSGKTS